MSGITAKSARDWADWLEDNTVPPVSVAALRAEADRLDAAAKTSGQMLAEIFGVTWERCTLGEKDTYERRAAAVVTHVVGPDQVIVNRYAAMNGADALDSRRFAASRAEFRRALDGRADDGVGTGG